MIFILHPREAAASPVSHALDILSIKDGEESI
jgi:hypothetical protein